MTDAFKIDSQEEEHKNRLEQCRNFFASFDSSSDAQFIADSIQFYLLDLWSVIRIDCSRQITKRAFDIPAESTKKLLHGLFNAIMTEEEFNSWQNLHGCLLGFISLIDHIPEDMLDPLTAKSLKFIGHIRSPIRDAAKDFLVKLNCKYTARKQLVSQILAMIEDILSKDKDILESEISATMLDGLLNCLVDAIPMVSESFISNCSGEGSPVRLARKAGDVKAFSLNRICKIVPQCMFHVASTVRQQAGHVISTILQWLSLSEPGENGKQVVFVINEVLINCLKKSGIDHWSSHEVCLIICEEFIRNIVNDALDALSLQVVGSLDDRQTIIDETVRLMSFLNANLDYLISHPRFEVRRVVLQLLPTISRAQILFSPVSRVSIDFSESMICSSSHPVLDLMLNITRLCFLMKEQRHFQEIINGSNRAPHWFTEAENWSLEVHGRLLELELRNDFRSKLERCIADHNNGVGFDHICRALLLSDSFILKQLNYIFDKLGTQFEQLRRKCEGMAISIDFLEFWSLTKCFLSNIEARDHWLISKGYGGNDNTEEDLIQVKEHVNKLYYSWIEILAGVQYFSVFSSQRTSQNSYAVSRATATEFVTMVMNSNHYFETFEREISLAAKKLINVTFGENGFEFRGIKLLPTLSDPATNPLLYIGVEDEESTVVRDFNPPNELFSSLSVSVSSPSGKSPASKPSISPHRSYSAKSPILPSPNKIGVGCNLPLNSNVASFLIMDRWNCEAISPLLLSITSALTSLEDSSLLSAIIVEWLVSCMNDPLWLDNKKFARRTLAESLPIVLLTVQKTIALHTLANEHRALMIYVSRAIGEALYLGSRNNPMELRMLVPITKSAIVGASIASELSPKALQDVHTALSSSSSLYTYNSFDAVLQTISCIEDAVKKLKQHYNLDTIPKEKLGSSQIISPNSSKLLPMPPLPPSSLSEHVQQQEESLSIEIDEFSDWDESESEESTFGAGDNYINGQSLLLDTFQLDSDYLLRLLAIWRHRIEQAYLTVPQGQHDISF